MTTTADRPDPGRLMQMSWSFAAPLLVGAGVRTGLFDLLEREPRTIEPCLSGCHPQPPWGAPQRVLPAHSSDRIAQAAIDLRAPCPLS